MNAHKYKLIKLIRAASSRHDIWQVFSDMCLLVALAIANGSDLASHKWKEREKRYVETMKRYDKDTQALFPQMFAEIEEALQACVDAGHYEDVLGQVFHELDIQNKYKAQYFTPQSVSDLMARVTLGSGEEYDKHLEEHGYVSLGECACGSGSTILGFINARIRLKPDAPFNDFVVHAGDVDERCVNMCFIQLSLYGVAAVVEQRNAITNQLIGERYYTPAYVWGLWKWRETAHESETLHDTTDPADENGQVLSTQDKENPPESEDVEMSLF